MLEALLLAVAVGERVSADAVAPHFLGEHPCLAVPDSAWLRARLRKVGPLAQQQQEHLGAG